MNERVKAGTAPCPMKGCELEIPVYTYRSSGDAKRSRFAGRLYGICPTDGRVEAHPYLQKHLKASDASNASQVTADGSANPVTPRVPTRRAPVKRAAPRVASKPSTTPAAPAARSSSSSSWLPEYWSSKK